MLADELKEQLKKIEPDITLIKQFWQNTQAENQFQLLEIVLLFQNAD